MSEGLETLKNMTEILLNVGCNDGGKLQALENIKKHFRPPDKILSRLSLLPVLQTARISLESKIGDKNFLFNYGMSLICNIGRDSAIDSEIIQQLEFILEKLKDDKAVVNLLINKLWTKLENGVIFQRDGILNASKQVIERTVLDWIDGVSNLQMEFLPKMASDSPKLFQMMTSLFHYVLVRTGCQLKVLEVQKFFVETVKTKCLKEGKNFLGLYPKGCARLVALLMVPPHVFTEGKEDILKDVISLLLEMFLVDRKRALILLSHYPDWITILKFNLEQGKV